MTIALYLKKSNSKGNVLELWNRGIAWALQSEKYIKRRALFLQNKYFVQIKICSLARSKIDKSFYESICRYKIPEPRNKASFTLESFPWQAFPWQVFSGSVNGKIWQVFPRQVPLLKNWHASFWTRKHVKEKPDKGDICQCKLIAKCTCQRKLVIFSIYTTKENLSRRTC